jgi:hypothetical protein
LVAVHESNLAVANFVLAGQSSKRALNVQPATARMMPLPVPIRIVDATGRSVPGLGLVGEF